MKESIGNKWLCMLIALIFFMISSSCEEDKKTETYYPESSPSVQTGTSVRGFKKPGSEKQTPEIFVQMGHIAGSFGYTNAVAFTPDGQYFLSGSGDKTIKLWEIETGREIKTFRCLGDVTHIDVSKDGRYLVSGDMYHNKNVNLWELSSGKKLKSFDVESSSNGHPVLFCDNDRQIIAGGGKETMKLWDVASGELIREFKADSVESQKPDVSSIVLTPDGKSAIAGYRYNGTEVVNGVTQEVTSRDNTIRIWDLATGRETSAFNKGKGWVEDLAVTPDGKLVLSCDYRQDLVSVWDIETGARVRTYPGAAGAIDISAGGRYALFGGVMGFRLVELSSGKEIRNTNNQGIEGWVRSIKFSPDGEYALVGDDTAKPMLWNLSVGKLATAFGGYADQIEAVKTSRTSPVMLTANAFNDGINIWDYRNGRLIKTIDRDKGSIMSSATLSFDGKFMATGGWNGRTSNAIIWDIAESKQISRMELKDDSSLHTQFLHITNDNKYLIWASPQYILTSDLFSGKELSKISYSGLNFERMVIDPVGQYIIVPSLRKGEAVYAYPQGASIKSLSDGEDVQCIVGKKSIYVFASLSDKTGRAGRFLTQYDLKTLKRISRKKVEGAFYGTGIEYNADYLFFYRYMGRDILKYDIHQDKNVASLTGHTADITDLDMVSDGRFLCSSSRDGTVRFWDPETGKEVVRFISFTDGEWIVITPEGYFNASEKGAKYLNVRVGNQVYSIDNFYEKYYNPAYVAAVLQKEKVQPAADIRQGVALPPEVKIISPENNAELKKDEVVVTVLARDMGGGIDEIRLYQNGKAVGEETRGIKRLSQKNERQKSYTITLVDGVNTFRAIGFSSDRTESNPSEITVKLIAPEKKVSLYVLAVGINKYKNPALNLNYAKPDAGAIADFFRKNGTELFKKVEITDVYNEDATKAAVLSKLQALRNTNPQDAVLIYLAGHGESINNEWYFIPYELTYPERETAVQAQGLSSDELANSIKNIKAQKVLVMIDACKSGAVLVAFRGFEDRKALAQLSRAAGVHVVAASSKEQFAAEVKELGHGVFTYTLLEGLNGKAAGKGDTITVRKLMGYVEEELPELTKKYKQEAQYPVVDSRGMDFPLVKAP